MKKLTKSLSEKEEKRVNAVFYCRYKSISRYAIRKRVPRQIHYAIATDPTRELKIVGEDE